MLERVLSWFGWQTAASTRASSRQAQRRPRSATAHLFAKEPHSAKKPAAKPAGKNDGFNPYNTGKFDRSASWERISKSQR